MSLSGGPVVLIFLLLCIPIYLTNERSQFLSFSCKVIILICNTYILVNHQFSIRVSKPQSPIDYLL